jgi:hypothetical protein
MMWRISLVIFACSISAAQATAGSLGYSPINPYMDWEPDCYKPTPPSFYVSDIDSFNWAVQEYNSYLSEVETYIACIQSEAEADISASSQAISNGYDEKRSQILNELDSANSDLEMQRSFLQ